MTATPPEAKSEYSRARQAFRGPAEGTDPSWRSPETLVLAAGLIGAVLLLVAEFSTLYVLHLTTSTSPVQSVSTGSHNSYALVPLALLGAVLAVAVSRQRSRAAAAAMAVLGVVALLIALVGDLPDTRARGIAHAVVLASTSAGSGLYLETLGAVVLLLTGGLALLLSAPAGITPLARPAH